MNQLLLGSLIFTVTRCESDLTDDDRSILQDIAAKIGSSPTILKVFIKGDIQEEDIEKLLDLSPREEKLPNNSPHFTRNRRNSIADYIGKLYSFNRLFRPYRSIFRGLNHEQTTEMPWLKKLLGGGQAEPRTEGFWGMALGAHTFSPIARPMAQTRVPYHRIRNQQRIDRLLGITRNYETTIAEHFQPRPLQWIKDRQKYEKFVVQAKNYDEHTTVKNERNKNVTTRTAYHRAPFDVAGFKTMNFSHLHAITTPRHLKFCVKQCPDEKEEARTRKPGSTEGGRPGSTEGGRPGSTESTTPSESQALTPGAQKEDGTTGDCPCTMEDCCSDCLSQSSPSPQPNCKSMIVKRVSKATKKRTTTKMTTRKFTRKKVEKITGPIWTLPPNSVLDQSQKEEQRGQQYTTQLSSEDETVPSSKLWFEITPITPESTGSSVDSSVLSTRTSSESTQEKAGTGKPRCTCRKPKPLKLGMLQCPHLPIPTRIPSQTTKQSTTCSTTQSTECECQAKLWPHGDIPVTVGETVERDKPSQSKLWPPGDIPVSVGETVERDKPSQSKSGCSCHQKKGKPKKIVVRISSALGEVPVVIMRDNGVCGVSLSLVNDYIIDENNRLIKCLSQKPVGRHTNLNGSRLNSKGYKGRHFIPELIRNQWYGLQPKQHSLRLQSKPARKLLQGSRASQGNSIENLYPEANQNLIPGLPIPNPFPAYEINSPDMPRMNSFGLPVPHFLGLQYPRRYGSFKMQPGLDSSNARLNHPGPPMAPMNLDEFSAANNIGPTDYPTFKIHQDVGHAGLNLPRFEPPGLNLQPAFPQRGSDESQLLDYRSPFLPIFYPSKNYMQPPKYIIPGLQ